MSESTLFVGLISGTSRDGVDAALVRFDEAGPALVGAFCLPYPEDLQERLTRLVSTGRRPADAQLAALDPAISDHFADAAIRLLAQCAVAAGDVRAIGSHGQTVWHAPHAAPPETVQLGRPAQIAARTGITTVGDFRCADLEAGGQGAPLAPLLHRALFRPTRGRRVVVNLGGIANISLIDPDGTVTGFDTGPANCLLDAWIRQQRGLAFDEAGRWAAAGRVDDPLLDAALADPYFNATGPKSTGLEYFNLDWLRRVHAIDDLEPADVQATLAELSAATVAEAVHASRATDVLLCGGGIHNRDLLLRLQTRLPHLPLRSTADAGLDPDWVEAVLFAWLARERLLDRPQHTQGITGATRAMLLGVVCNPTGV